MQVTFDRSATSAFYDASIMGEYYDPPGIEVSENGTARVKEEVGEQLVNEYDTINKLDNE